MSTFETLVGAQAGWDAEVGALLPRVDFVGFSSSISLAELGFILFDVCNALADPTGRRWGDRLGNTRVVETGGGML